MPVRKASDYLKGFVYIAKDPTGEYVKIGFSVNPKKRIKHLGAPFPMVPVVFTAATLFDEQCLHFYLQDSKLYNEWYRGNSEAVRHVIQVLLSERYYETYEQSAFLASLHNTFRTYERDLAKAAQVSM